MASLFRIVALFVILFSLPALVLAFPLGVVGIIIGLILMSIGNSMDRSASERRLLQRLDRLAEERDYEGELAAERDRANQQVLFEAQQASRRPVRQLRQVRDTAADDLAALQREQQLAAALKRKKGSGSSAFD